MLDWLYLAPLLVVAVVIILLALKQKDLHSSNVKEQEKIGHSHEGGKPWSSQLVAYSWMGSHFRGSDRKKRVSSFPRAILIVALLFGFNVFVVLLYGQWGGWFLWKNFQKQQAKTEQVQAILKQFKTPDVLIQKLKQKLNEAPGNARGWYLLGRLYASQNDWRAAHDSFQKAIQHAPSNERYLMNDIYAEWMVNQQQFNAGIRKKLQSLVQKNSKQPDALALLAMDAYQQKNYREAITYWQRLLVLAPADSEAASALRKAIAKAQRKL